MREPAALSDYRVIVTTDPVWVRAAQRMRYEVFSTDYGATFDATAPGLDRDEFDAHCEHLIVVHAISGAVVGTCRMLRPAAAAVAGGRYSARLFDLSAHASIDPSELEVGRLCVRPEHRNGSVISSIWAGILRHAERSGCRWLAGCQSIPLRDRGALAATTWNVIAKRYLAPPHLAVKPRVPWPAAAAARTEGKLPVPPLLRGYLRLGALVCGEPAHDPDFRSADLYVLLDIARGDRRYYSRYTSMEAS